MFVSGRLACVAAITVCAVSLAAGCSSGDDSSPDRKSLIDVTTMRGALLQAAEIGPSWTAPTQTADPQQLVSICGGTTAPPAVPPGAEVVAAPFVDEGDTGAQSLEQFALVYPDQAAAQAGQAILKAAADSCQPSVSVPQTVNDEKAEPAYTETVALQPLSQGSWSGFAVIRHKKYEPAHPGTADAAVAILTTKNVVLVDAYAIYRLNNASTAPGFDTDWEKLVGSVVQRVG